jgi:heptosyltransferase II
MSHVERILVRGVNWLGDAVMTTPALQRLREAKPHAHISLLTPAKLTDLWNEHPAINEIVTFADNEGLWSVGRRLRRGKFDLAIVFPNSPRSALEVVIGGIPERVGYARPWRSFFLNRNVKERAGEVPMRKRSVNEITQRIAQDLPRESFPFAGHHVHDYLHLVAAVGAAAVPCPPMVSVSENEVNALRQRFGLTDSPLFGLNPGAEYGPAKRWPKERFIEAGVRLQKETGCRWLLFGGAGDRALADEITRALSSIIGARNVINTAGELSLRELCAGLKACAVVLTNDTGPMHVAAAVGTPIVVPFGSTSPELTGPSYAPASLSRLVIGNAACAPCFLRECPVDFRCMKSISVEQVVKTVLNVWEGRIPA